MRIRTDPVSCPRVENKMETLGVASGSADFRRSLFESMSDGCAHCRVIFEGDRAVDWVYLVVNPAFETATGLKNVVGRRITELLPGIQASSPELFEIYGRVAAGGGPEFIESYLKTLDAWLAIEVMGAGPGEFIAKFKNITSAKERETAFRTVFEMSPVGIFLHREGRFVDLNPAALRIFGAQGTAQVIGEPISNRVPTREQAGQRARIQRAMAGEEETRFIESRILTLDGTEVEVEVLGRLVTYRGFPTVLVAMNDISERKRAEEALRQQEAFIRSILDNLPVGIAVSSSDPRGAPVYMNELFPKYYRTTREAIEGVAVDPATREAIEARALEDLSSGDPSRMHWERIPISPEGEGTTYVDARNIPVPGSSTMIWTVWDVTEQVQREEETRRLEAQLHQVQKMESLGLLAGGVAHDINNVLGAILAVATIHRRKAADGTPLHQGMETIAQACLRGGALVKSLLGFARKGLPAERPLNLNDLISKELRQLERTISKHISIQEDLSDRLREMKGDPAALGHAILNLCVNAIEAMPEGGTLTVRTSNSGPNAIVLEVLDTGTGMAPEVMHQALVPFYSTKPAGTAGIGLGLAIVHGTVRSHRGTLDVQSEPGKGTRVRLRFPTSESPLKGDSGSNEAFGSGAAAGKSILFVDDDPLILRSFSGLIEANGHKNTAVSSGEEALALIDQGFRPDLVILDVNMPGIGGLETLVQLRRQMPTLPVLLSSGLPSQYLRDLVKQHPGVYLISKPFTIGDLERKINLAVS
jgi:PAS domain S-box-containing protein